MYVDDIICAIPAKYVVLVCVDTVDRWRPVHFSCSWLASKYKLVFIIVVIVQPKITQAVKLEQMYNVAPFKMAAACVTMTIIVDDVVLEALSL